MSEIEEHITIAANVATNDDLDFQFLRDAGQEYIEKLSRKYWTDYNIHDPAITIEETVSFAITELGLMMDQSVPDLLASKEKNFLNMHQQFKSAKNILTCKPVTEWDYRKLFIDIDGVKNCWLSKNKLSMHVECNAEAPKVEFDPFVGSEHSTTKFDVKGLYNILVDFDDDFNQADVTKEIYTRYHKNRNLCEDLVKVKKVNKQCIRVCTEIQLENGIDEEFVHAQIQWEIAKYLSPKVRMATLTEMLDSGLSTDKIFQGPVLQNGFITNEELENSGLRTTVRLSDIIHLIMDIDGVKLVEDISIDNCPPDAGDSDCNQNITAKSDAWIICVENNHLPVLCDKSTFKYKKGFIPVGINEERVEEYIQEFEDAEEDSASDAYEDLPMPTGTYSEIKYSTIQHHLPENYGVSTYGLPQNATGTRKVQAKQLQAYLLFFDQVLSTYFSHLEHVKQLLSNDDELKKTYFFKAVENIDGIEGLVNDYEKYQVNVENLLGDLDDFHKRRNQLLDHLTSRFAEVFEDYTSAMYKLFGKASESVEDNILSTKNKFLKEYEIISSERGLAFNYTGSEVWDTDNVSGFQKRIALLSGISNYDRRDLFNDNLYIETLERNTGTDGTFFEYRWKIKNGSTTFLSSKGDFNTKQQAIDDLLIALKLATDHDNFKLGKTSSNKFYVALCNAKGEIIGKRFSYNKVRATAIVKMKATIAFIAELIFEEGFYLIENILTLPHDKNEVGNINDCLPLCVEDDCGTCGDIDPFSYQVTIIFPGYSSRFSNIDFRIYMENLIRRELPAHILPRICWVGHVDGAMSKITENNDDPDNPTYTIEDNEEDYDIRNIENTWKAFLLSKNKKSNNYMATKATIKNLWCALTDVNTIYPNGTLHDCENEETELNNKIILNRSALGSL